MANPQRYTYVQAGFNNFMDRSIEARGAGTLNDASTLATITQNQEINFDQKQTRGSLGDVIQVGKIRIDGRLGRIALLNDTGAEIMRVGNLSG